MSCPRAENRAFDGDPGTVGGIGTRAGRARASTDPAHTRALRAPWQRVGRSALGTALVVAALALALVAMLSAGDDSSERAVAEARTAHAELVVLQWNIEVDVLEIMALRLLDAAAAPGDRSARLAELADDLTTSLDGIERLAETPGPVADEATDLFWLLSEDDAYEPLVGDIDVLWELAYDARGPFPAPPPGTPIDTIDQLAFTQALGWHIVIESLPAIFDASDVDIVDAFPAFHAEAQRVLETESGWFDREADRLLAASSWFGVEEARVVYPDEIAEIEQLVDRSTLHDLDSWVQTDRTSPPPTSAQDAVDAAAEITAAVRPIADALLADEIADDRDLVADPADGARSTWWIVFLVGAALCLGAAGTTLLVMSVRESRRRVALATIDPLTGVGNRRQLDELVGPAVARPGRSHHVVAIVDLDRFKLVNDAHGHRAGDLLLIELARRLTAVVESVAGEHDGSGSVVRLGGDEFLAVVHAGDASADAVLRERLDAVRQDAIDVDGVVLELGFSLGVASAPGPADVHDLMAAADLSLYREKSVRRAERSAATSRGTSSADRSMR